MEEKIPQLTLTPDLSDTPAMEVKPELELTQTQEDNRPEAGPDLSQLTEAEQKAVLDFAEKIDICDSQLVMQYGAAAQKKFEYRVPYLANGLLTDEQKAYATTTVSYVDTSKSNDNYRANVYLVSNIQFMMAFANIDPTMNAEVTFTDHYGKEHLITIPGSEFEKNGSYYVFTIEETVVADAYQNITCKIYNADGKLVNQVTDSMASYAARAKLNTGDELYEMIMKFATSAHAYLHSK